MVRCTPDVPVEVVAAGEGCAWHLAAVHWAFSLSREGEDCKACRFSNALSAKLRLVRQGYANGREMPTVLLCMAKSQPGSQENGALGTWLHPAGWLYSAARTGQGSGPLVKCPLCLGMCSWF